MKETKPKKRAVFTKPDNKYAIKEAQKEQNVTTHPPPIAKVKAKHEMREKSVIVNCTLFAGKETSKRIDDLAKKYNQSIDDIFAAARLRASKKLKTLIKTKNIPTQSTHEKGGLITRFSTKYHDDEAVLLYNLFDPLEIGVASKKIKEIMTSLFQAELKIILDQKG